MLCSKNTTLRTVGSLIVSLAFTVPLLANANAQDVEQRPLAELPNSISGTETVRDRMQDFIEKDRTLRLIRKTQKDETGRSVLLFTATGTIAASPDDPSFMAARIAAFEKAMLDAKSACATFQSDFIKTEAVMHVTRPSQDRARADAEQMKREGLLQEGAAKAAAALNSDLTSRNNMPQVIKTAALYGEKIISEKMNAGLKKLGLDPTKPVDQQVARSMVERVDFENVVSTVAAARCTGLKAVAAFEQNPSKGRGSVGIITVWSEKLHAVADAMVTNNWNLVPKKEPGHSLDDHIPSDKRTLLTTYGAQLVRDENGDLILLAYAQDGPRSKNQQSIDIAYKAADTRARGLIRSFVGELVATNSGLLNSEASSDFSDGSSRYESKDSYDQFIKTAADSLQISGIVRVREWETLHPSNNSPVVGVIVQWSVASSQLATQLFKMNKASGSITSGQTLVGGGSGSSPSSESPSSEGKAVEPRNAESYKGQGRSSREF